MNFQHKYLKYKSKYTGSTINTGDGAIKEKNIKIYIKKNKKTFLFDYKFYNNQSESEIIETLIEKITNIEDEDDEHSPYFDMFSTNDKKFIYYNELEKFIKEYKNSTSNNLELVVHSINNPRNVAYLLFTLRYTKKLEDSPFSVMLLEWLFKNITKDEINKDTEFLLILDDYFVKKQNKINNTSIPSLQQTEAQKLCDSYTKFRKDISSQGKNIKMFIKYRGNLIQEYNYTFYNYQSASEIIYTIINDHIKKIKDDSDHELYFNMFSTNFNNNDLKYYTQLEEFIK